MNYPTNHAVKAIGEKLDADELRGYYMRSVHSDGSVSFYWRDGRKIHITRNGGIMRTEAATA